MGVYIDQEAELEHLIGFVSSILFLDYVKSIGYRLNLLTMQ